MGQNQSRDAQRAPDVLKASDYSNIETWSPTALDAYIRIVKRSDGSSVKELYISSWQVTFFRSGGSLELIDKCTDGSGVYIQIDVDSAAILYKAWLKHKEAKAAVFAALPVFGKYADTFLKL